MHLESLFQLEKLEEVMEEDASLYNSYILSVKSDQNLTITTPN
jgi:hypothetical protein